MRLAEAPSALWAEPRDPSAEGLWEVLDYQLPIPAAHAALLPTGKVLFLPGGRRLYGANRAPRACLWDCSSANFKTWNLAADFSLGGQCLLPDGRLLVVGGTRQRNAIRLKETFLFDPLTEDWLRISDIPERGACPALIEVGDGRVLAVGGAGKSRIHEYEKANGWSATEAPHLDWPLYPQLTLLADGSVLYSGQHFGGRGLLRPGLLHPRGSFSELPVAAVPPDFLFNYRTQGATVLLPPAQDQRAMTFGGGSPPKRNVYVVDFSGSQPIFRPAEPIRFPRANFNTVVLPDRTVLVCGGIRSEQGALSNELEAELFNPLDGAWAPAGVARVPRREHSSALLLPDGRVITAGSTNPSGAGELRLELYHPPYLFRGNRPIVEDAPREIKFGETFSVKTADSDIRWVSLVKPMAVAHSFDPGQRLLDLPFESRGSGTLEAIVPKNANLAPPGPYLLFLINHMGTPSQGQWVYLAGMHEAQIPRTEATRQDRWPNGRAAWQSRGRHSWNGSDHETDRIHSQAPGRRSLENVPLRTLPEIPHQRSATSTSMEEPESPTSMEEPASSLSAEDLPDPLREEEPEISVHVQELESSTLVGEPEILVEEPESSAPLQDFWDQQLAEDGNHQQLADSVISSPASAPAGGWNKWARPALIVGSAGLLTLSIVLQVAPLRAAAAFVFLLFAPGMALVGLYPPSGWESELALAVGLSVALETILTVVMLYLGTWSAERTFLILLIVSLSGAVIQLFKAAFVSARSWKHLKGLDETAA